MSLCEFSRVEHAADGSFRLRCVNCGRETGFRFDDNVVANCRLGVPSPPEESFTSAPVGTHLTALLKELGSEPTQSCACPAHAAQMDAWGIEGCERNRGEIIRWLEVAYNHSRLLEAMRIGWNGLFIINPLDPFNSLLNEAIRRTVKNAEAIMPHNS
jgi:hypothetical protein